MTTAIIVQSRSGSTRLPRKAFLPLGGRTLTHIVLEALSYARTPDIRILAVPERDVKAFSPIAEEYGFYVFGGSEEDVLKRYAEAAAKYSCDVIIRATGDNPFVCPLLLDAIVMHHKAYDAALSHFLGIALGSGVEVISSEALYAAATHADTPYMREHVTPWIYANRDRYIVEEPVLSLAPELRLTVDTAEDLARAEAILARCGHTRPIALKNLLPLYHADPKIWAG